MATTTPNLGLLKPVVGADADAWGGQLNASLDVLDVKVLDKTTGGTVSGNLSVTGTVNTPNVNAATSLSLQTGGTTKATLDSAGNLGLGVTPSAWGAGKRVLQIGPDLSLFYNAQNDSALVVNTYNDGTNNRYIANGFATNYRQNVGNHQWFTAPSGTAGAPITFTQAMTLTQGGNLLVGLTTPAFGGLVEFTSQNNSGSVSQAIYNTGTGGARLNLLNNLNSGAIEYLNTDGLKFFVTDRNTERARITSGGYFKASNTGVYNNVAASFHETRNSLNEPVQVAESTNTGSNVFVYYSILPGSATGFLYIGQTGTAVVYKVLANGNVQNTNNSYGAISDIKLKENVTDATPKLASLNQLRVVNYNLKTDPGFKQIGLIAQEVEQVFPGLVESTPDVDSETKEPTGTVTKSVKYSVLVPMLLKAVQELSAKVAALEAK